MTWWVAMAQGLGTAAFVPDGSWAGSAKASMPTATSASSTSDRYTVSPRHRLLAALGPHVFRVKTLIDESPPLFRRVRTPVRRQVPPVGAFIRQFAQQCQDQVAERAEPPHTSSALRRESTNGDSDTCADRVPRRIP